LADIVPGDSADALYNQVPLSHSGMVITIDLYRMLLSEYRLNSISKATAQARFNRTWFTAATCAPAKGASYERFKRDAAHDRPMILLGGSILW
jgi:hypothetical protein